MLRETFNEWPGLTGLEIYRWMGGWSNRLGTLVVGDAAIYTAVSSVHLPNLLCSAPLQCTIAFYYTKDPSLYRAWLNSLIENIENILLVALFHLVWTMGWKRDGNPDQKPSRVCAKTGFLRAQRNHCMITALIFRASPASKSQKRPPRKSGSTKSRSDSWD
jgi:hypothetical protein